MSAFTTPDPPRIHRPLYRVYHLTRTGSIERAEIIEAIDDADAIEMIRAMAGDHACELWDRARFVAKAEPPPAALVPEPMLVRRAPAEAPTLADEPAPALPLHH